MSDRLRRGAAAADDEEEVEVPFYEKAAEVSLDTSTESPTTADVSMQIVENFETTSSPLISESNGSATDQTEPASVVTAEPMTTSGTSIEDEDNATEPVTTSVILTTTSEPQVVLTTVDNSVEPIVFDSTTQVISAEDEENSTLGKQISRSGLIIEQSSCFSTDRCISDHNRNSSRRRNSL